MYARCIALSERRCAAADPLTLCEEVDDAGLIRARLGVPVIEVGDNLVAGEKGYEHPGGDAEADA